MSSCSGFGVPGVDFTNAFWSSQTPKSIAKSKIHRNLAMDFQPTISLKLNDEYTRRKVLFSDDNLAMTCQWSQSKSSSQTYDTLRHYVLIVIAVYVLTYKLPVIQSKMSGATLFQSCGLLPGRLRLPMTTISDATAAKSPLISVKRRYYMGSIILTIIFRKNV